MSNFLEPSQCLVYLETGGHVSEVAGYTYIARNIRMFYDKDRAWYEVRLETAADGKPTIARNTIFVSADHIVSERPYVAINPKSFYQYDNDGIKAANFVFKDDRTDPLTSTSRTALGSGIYGTVAINYGNDQKPYLIQVPRAYDVQDAEHGDAITMASLATNIYIDGILASLNNQQTSNLLDISNATINYEHLVTLWNIVFYRTTQVITKEQLSQLLAQYIYQYRKPSTLVDTMIDVELAELPINSIMRFMGYHGLIATDTYNNGWDRGCVSYDYDTVGQILGSVRKDNIALNS